MPFGVSKDFLDVLEQGKRRALVGLAPLIGAGLLGGVAAELLDPPRLGDFVLLYAGAIVLGLGLGGLLGWLETRAWGESLRDGWSEWMHSAVGAGSVDETAERAGAWTLPAIGVWAAILVVLNASCLLAAWWTLPPFTLTDPYGALAVITVAATGATVGIRTVSLLVEGWWCREIEAQTLDLVHEGRVGVWGYR